MSSCDRWRDALSAMSDGEAEGVDPRLVEAHLARCAECRSFQARLRLLQPAAHVREAEAMPDLSRAVVARVTLADRLRHWSLVRVLLAAVAIEVIVLAVPDLVTSTLDGTAAHDARHLGAFSVAYAVGLLVVVWRPARARTILPVAGVLAGALCITAIVDIAEGRVPLTGEATHLPEIVSVVLVWLLAVPAPGRFDPFRRATRRRTGGGGEPALRLVEPASRDHRDAV